MVTVVMKQPRINAKALTPFIGHEVLVEYREDDSATRKASGRIVDTWPQNIVPGPGFMTLQPHEGGVMAFTLYDVNRMVVYA
jgi:hypothetical protein